MPEPATPPADLDTRRKQRDRLSQQLDAMIPEFAKMLPKSIGIDASRFVSLALNCVLKDPKLLLECTRASVLRAIRHAAEVGLEPGGAHGHAYIIPRSVKVDKGRWEMQAECMIGVWGYVELARRNPQIANVWADVIYAEDSYRVTSGSTGRNIEHVPRWDLPEAQRGPIVGAYACARLANGDVSSELMNLAELEKARESSSAPDSPAWKTWKSEMYKRSAIKRAQKYWPKGRDMIRALAIEAEAETIETEGYAAPGASHVVRPRALPASRGQVLDDILAADSRQAEPAPVAAES